MKDTWETKRLNRIQSAYRAIAKELRLHGLSVLLSSGGMITQIGDRTGVGKFLEVCIRGRWWTERLHGSLPADLIPLNVIVRSGSSRAKYFRSNKAGGLPVENIATAILVVLKDLEAKDELRRKQQERRKRDEEIRQKLCKAFPSLNADYDAQRERKAYLSRYGELDLTVHNLSEKQWRDICKVVAPLNG